MLPRLEKGCKILEWAIKNKKPLVEATRQFDVSENFVRKVAKDCSGKEGYDTFDNLYKSFKTAIQTDDEVLLSTEVIKKNSVKFIEEQKNKGVLDARGNKHVKTLDEIIKEAKIDLNLWSIDRHVINKWDVTTKHGRTYQNWQVKIWLTKRQEIEDAIEFDKYFVELLEKHNPFKYKSVKYNKIKEDTLLEVSLYDLHLGKLCWSEEVNNNYDIKIASARFNYVLSELLERAKSNPFNRILYVVGNDFFNSDNHLNTTTGGTRQDEDSRWQKTFKMGVKLQVSGIDFMRQFAPVDVKIVPGNHDYTKSIYLGEVLGAWYRSDKSVVVDNAANPRKYYEFGRVLLGLTHGNNESHDKLRALMAYEAAEAWARTKYREWHVGHQHRKISDKFVTKANMTHEEHGIIVRAMSSLAGTDAWHHQMGFLGPTRAAEALLWSSEQGLLGNLNVNIKLNDDL